MKKPKKNKFKIILITLAGCILIPSLITIIYVFSGNPDKKLKPEKEEEIKQAYLEYRLKSETQSINDVGISFYYGTYYGYAIIKIRGNFDIHLDSSSWEFKRGGVIIKGVGACIMAYKNGKLYTLEEISESHLTIFDIWRIYNIEKKYLSQFNVLE